MGDHRAMRRMIDARNQGRWRTGGKQYQQLFSRPIRCCVATALEESNYAACFGRRPERDGTVTRTCLTIEIARSLPAYASLHDLGVRRVTILHCRGLFAVCGSGHCSMYSTLTPAPALASGYLDTMG